MTYELMQDVVCQPELNFSWHVSGQKLFMAPCSPEVGPLLLSAFICRYRQPPRKTRKETTV